MWLFFGFIAIVFAILNLSFSITGRDPAYFRFLSMSFTALTLCALYSQDAEWIINNDFSALMDVVPAMSKACYILTLVSIFINGISLYKNYKTKR